MTSNLFHLKNLEMGNTLKKYLAKERAKGTSYRAIATNLSQSGATVGRTAVDTWCKSLGLN